MLTLVEHELVHRLKWIDQDEFLRAMTVGQTIPGVIICNVSGFIAYRLCGIWGLLITLLALVLPSFFVVVAFAAFYSLAKDQLWLKNFFKGLGPAVAAALASLTWRMGWKSLRHWLLIGAGIISFVLLEYCHLHPVWVILGMGIVGVGLTFMNHPKGSLK